MSREKVDVENSQRRRWLRLISVLAFLPAALCGCDRKPREGKLQTSRVRIERITPSTEFDLVAGTPIRLTATVNYYLQAKVGQVSFVVQTGDGDPVAQVFDVVRAGHGELTQEVYFRVPSTSALKVFSAVTEEGMRETFAVDSRAYRIVPASPSKT